MPSYLTHHAEHQVTRKIFTCHEYSLSSEVDSTPSFIVAESISTPFVSQKITTLTHSNFGIESNISSTVQAIFPSSNQLKHDTDQSVAINSHQTLLLDK